jgi:trk system potassium uptake protein TrkA
MRILIVGAGEVGSSIAGSLSETHDVVVIDVDSSKVDALTYAEDVLAIAGDGTSLDVLEEAGVRETDIVIASTDKDETNLAICATVDTVSDAFTIARVQKQLYLETWRRSEGAFCVDFMVSTNLLTARTIVQVIGIPTARDVDRFSEGAVQVAEFDVPADSPLADETVAAADRFEDLTFAALIRDDEALIPSGTDSLQWGDTVVVIGLPKSVEAFAEELSPPGAVGGTEDILIVGGSDTGELVAELLEDRHLSVRLIERDPVRARELAEGYPNTAVLEHDVTDLEFLDREHVRDADLAVVTLDTDAMTLLVALLLKQVGVDRTVAVVDDAQFVDLFEAVGVDVAVNPRKVTAEEITRFTRERQAENVAIVEPGNAEVLEFEVKADSVLVDRPIRESVTDLPAGVVVGAITRNGRYIKPRGDTEVKQDDHVVLFVRDEAMSDVAEKV